VGKTPVAKLLAPAAKVPDFGFIMEELIFAD